MIMIMIMIIIIIIIIIIKIASADLTLEINAVVQPATVVRDLGVLVDQEMTLKQHVTKVQLHPAASVN